MTREDETTYGRIKRTEVWISRDEMVERWLYEASLEASEAIRSKMSETNELRIAMALLLDCQFSICTTRAYSAEQESNNSRDTSVGVDLLEDLVDVRRVGLDPLLGALLATFGLGGRGLGGLLISSTVLTTTSTCVSKSKTVQETYLSGGLGGSGGGLGGLRGRSLGSGSRLGSHCS